MASRTPLPDAPDWGLERSLWGLGYAPVAGVDEAGRGALAGPVAAAAAILPFGEHPFRDSKTIRPGRREELAEEAKRCALAWSVGWAEAAEVDRLGVLAATHVAVRRALAGLRRRPAALATDYLAVEGWPCRAVPKGDARSFQIAAASLLAKTARDARMVELAERWPGYGFERHKGYGSGEHLRALRELGPCPEHRRSFRPVAQGGLFVP